MAEWRPAEEDPLAMETASITIRAGFNAEGENTYNISTTGELPMTSYLSLLVIAQQHVLSWGNYEADE